MSLSSASVSTWQGSGREWGSSALQLGKAERKNAFCSHFKMDQSSKQGYFLTLFSHLHFSPS